MGALYDAGVACHYNSSLFILHFSLFFVVCAIYHIRMVKMRKIVQSGATEPVRGYPKAYRVYAEW